MLSDRRFQLHSEEISMETPIERVEILRQEVARFKERVANLAPQDRELPSACDGWTVADVVAHLVGQAFPLTVSRGLQGDYSPPPGAPAVTAHNEDDFARNIFQRAFNTRAEVGDRLLEALAERLDESVTVFEGVGHEQWDNLCYWPPGPETVRVMLDMRISELSMHAWDVCSRFDSDYRLSDGAVRVLMDTVPRAVRRAFRPDPSLSAPVIFRFAIDAPVVALYDLVFTPEGAVLQQPQDPKTTQADVAFRCDGETYVMVMYGRTAPDAAIASGRLLWEGDDVLALGFGRRFLGG